MAFDALGMLRKVSDAGYTTSANFPANPGLQIDGTPASGVSVRVHVPQATGTSPTVDIVIQDSADGTTWADRLTFAQIIAAGEYRQRLVTNKKYVRAKMTSGGTTPNFGIVQIGLETAGEYKDF